MGRIDGSGITIDFGRIKDYFKKEWDHKFIIPLDDVDYWNHIYQETGYSPVFDNLKPLDFTTAEGMAAEIAQALLSIALEEMRMATDYSDGVPEVHFELSEGPGQGVKV